jgi:hypothetical protein
MDRIIYSLVNWLLGNKLDRLMAVMGDDGDD